MLLLPRAEVRALVAPLLALAVVGCAPASATDAPVRVATPAPAGPLLTVETRGGLCPDGPCGTTIVVERDGRVHVAAKPPNDLGTVPAPALAALEAAIGAADFAALRSRPFRGTCPTAYDGQETVFEFGTPGGSERIATCEVEIDLGAPLFVAMADAIGPFITIRSP